MGMEVLGALIRRVVEGGFLSGCVRIKDQFGQSEIIPVGEVEEVDVLAVELGCRVGSLPSSFLGLPLGAPNKAISMWDGVEERVRRRLALWKPQYISKGRKITLIKRNLLNVLRVTGLLWRMTQSLGRVEETGSLELRKRTTCWLIPMTPPSQRIAYGWIGFQPKSLSLLGRLRGGRLFGVVSIQLRVGEAKSAQARSRKGHEGEAICEEDDACTSEQLPNDKQPEDPDVHSHEHAGEEHINDKEGAQRKGRSRGRGKGRGRGQYHHHGNRGNHVGTPPNSSINHEQPAVAKPPPGPRMPDGTRGFSMGRGKPVAVNIA
ncbi:La-related protein 6B [Vitis vinifera]|uniref:La-related protein 6B n=1 Tax=Vitis vinifera TaxID=29760 RepID=A0A438CAS0_VITVI|nr:La-related protein 6B [Vitis vinifera]